MSNTDAFEIAFNRVRVAVEEGFFEQVKDRMDVLQTRVNEQVRELFEDIALSMGEEAVPAEIAGYTDWSDLTYQWIKRKKSKGNRFYIGKSRGMQRALGAKAGKFVYGEPSITIGSGLGRGFTEARGRVRVSKGFSGGGRFASRSSALRVTLTVTPFPNLGDSDEMFAPFKGKAGLKMAVGEFGTDNRPSRPFLGPFVRYYTEVKIPEVIERTIRL